MKLLNKTVTSSYESCCWDVAAKPSSRVPKTLMCWSIQKKWCNCTQKLHGTSFFFSSAAFRQPITVGTARGTRISEWCFIGLWYFSSISRFSVVTSTWKKWRTSVVVGSLQVFHTALPRVLSAPAMISCRYAPSLINARKQVILKNISWNMFATLWSISR